MPVIFPQPKYLARSKGPIVTKVNTMRKTAAIIKRAARKKQNIKMNRLKAV